MILYHCISSYHILCAVTHKLLFNQKNDAVLLLPDFITKKYPQYEKLTKVFKEVKLFPYMEIPHDETTLLQNIKRKTEQVFKNGINDYDEINVFGAHFYFSLYLIENKLKFNFFEDAVDMIKKAENHYETLKKQYPLQANYAKRLGLFDGSNPLIDKIYVSKTQGYLNERIFNVAETLKHNKKIVKVLKNFFNTSRVRQVKCAYTLLLTEQLVGLGKCNEEEQKQKYKDIYDKYNVNKLFVVKKHPDDFIDYSYLGKNVRIIKVTFPVELLPYVLKRPPELTVTINSTSINALSEWTKKKEILYE